MKNILFLILINCTYISYSQVEKSLNNSRIDSISVTQNTNNISKIIEISNEKKPSIEKTEPPKLKNNTLNILKLKWIELLGLLISILAFFIPIYRYLSQKREEQKDKRFQTYHKLIADLVTPPGGMLDRQIATVFELRNFPDYYELTKRIMTDLIIQWSNSSGNPRLVTELEITLNYIGKMSKWYNQLKYYTLGIK